MPCFDEAAARFGWSNRQCRAGGMTRDGDLACRLWLRCGQLPDNVAAAPRRALSLTPEGKQPFGCGDMRSGTGAYTTVGHHGRRLARIDVKDVTVRLGDSDLPAR